MYNTDFNILFLARQVSDKFFESDKLSALENETGFRFFREEEEKYILFIFEPNNDEPYRSIDIREFIKEHTNANNIKENPRELEKITDSLIKRSRGIIQERENRSRAEIARSSEIQTGSRSICEGRESICGVNGDEIWRRDFDARVSLQELQVREQNLKKTNYLIQQSESYKQQALKSYQQSGVTFTPKNLQNEITSSLNKEDSSNNSNHQENSSNQSNQSKLFSNFTNKLNTIHQNLTNPIDTISLNDTLEIDKSKSQDNQESQDSYLKIQYQMKRSRK
ncbi:hypothetical protein [Helicobacter ganmani]|uniref:hypothetical protein n=1 Tax=Helicobacter ganmani TaxID=60246 RepID=UPI003A8871A6